MRPYLLRGNDLPGLPSLPVVHLGEHNIFLAGGPAHGGLAWMLFGSAYDDRLTPSEDPFVLPYTFCPDEDHQVYRPVQYSSDFAPAINWTIRSDNHPRSPRTGPQNRLTQDFLLMSVLPNPLSTGKSIVNFAGTHGVGTRAARFVLRDQAILKTLDTLELDAHQVLFSVEEIGGGSGQHLKYLEHKEVEVRADAEELLLARLNTFQI
jgi:hypothetical protein